MHFISGERREIIFEKETIDLASYVGFKVRNALRCISFFLNSFAAVLP